MRQSGALLGSRLRHERSGIIQSEKRILPGLLRTYCVRDGQSRQHATGNLKSTLKREVAELTPSSIDLDLQTVESFTSGSFDIAELSATDSALSGLWKDSNTIAVDKLRPQLGPTWHPHTEHGAVVLALQCVVFCEQLEKTLQPLEKGRHPQDFYVMAHMCLQHIWGLAIDGNTKAWACGMILCRMAGAAGRLQEAEGFASVWVDRCITSARLGLHILNHPGRHLQASLPVITFHTPQFDFGLDSEFHVIAPYYRTFQYQAVAASWAAFCSRQLPHNQEQTELDFLNLHIFYTMQHGLDHTVEDSWQAVQPCRPGFTMLNSALTTLAEKRAPEQHPKPGGWGKKSWLSANLPEDEKRPVTRRPLVLVNYSSRLLSKHRAWCQSLQSEVTSSVESYAAKQALGGEIDSTSYKSFPAIDAGRNQALTSAFMIGHDIIEAPAVVEGWYEDAVPQYLYCKPGMFSPEVLAPLAICHMNDGKWDSAVLLLMRSLSYGYEDGFAAWVSTSAYLQQSRRQPPLDGSHLDSMHQAAVLMALCLRARSTGSQLRTSIDKTYYPLYAEAVLAFTIQSKRTHCLWQILDIICTGVDSRDSPSQYFVAAIQKLDQQHPLKVMLLTLMADQGMLAGKQAWQAAVQEISHANTDMELLAACDLAGRAHLDEVHIDALHLLWDATSGLTAIKGSELIDEGPHLPLWAVIKMLHEMTCMPDLEHNLEQASLSAETVITLLEALHYDLVEASASADQFEGLVNMFASAPTAVTATDFDSALMSSFSRLACACSATAQSADVLSDFKAQWCDGTAAKECLARHAPKHPVVQALPSVTWQLYLYATKADIQLTHDALLAVWDSQAQPGREARLCSMWQEAFDVISEGAVQKLLLLALTLQQWYAAACFAHIICKDTPACGQVAFTVILEQARQSGRTTQANVLSQGLPTMSDTLNVVQGKQIFSSGGSNEQTSQSRHAEEIVLHMHAEGRLNTDATLTMALRALKMEAPSEAQLAQQLMEAAYAPGSEVQQAFLEQVCHKAEPEMALHQLQRYHEVAAECRHVYSMLVWRLSPDLHEVPDILGEATICGSAIMSGLIAACPTCEELPPAQQAVRAWLLFEQAVAAGHDLHDEAQAALWAIQSGEALLQLFYHQQAGNKPVLQAPTAAVLLAIASAATQAQDYAAAMTAAKPCAVQFPQDAADIVADIVQGLSSSGSPVTLAAEGMPVLQKAGHHTEVLKVFGLLQGDSQHHISADELLMAMLSWVTLGNAAAAREAMHRHDQLTRHFSPAAQQTLFDEAMIHLTAQPGLDTSALALNLCMVAAAAKLPQSSQQIQALVQALPKRQLQREGHQILKRLSVLMAIPADCIHPVLALSLKGDMEQQELVMSRETCEVLDLWQECCQNSWTQQLGGQEAHMLAEFLNSQKRWQETAAIFQDRTANGQTVLRPLWDAALTAYQHLKDPRGIYSAWGWLQAEGHDWLPALPSCHTATLLAVTALHDHPMQGAILLLAYPSKLYDSVLPVSVCEEFIRSCQSRIETNDNVSGCLEAMWHVLDGVKPSALPLPSCSMYTLATQAVVSGLHHSDALPAHHALVLLQQHLWAQMHAVSSSKAEISAYLPALLCFQPTEVLQTILLMAQNGILGLNFACCEALFSLPLDQEQSQWLQNVFGAQFIEQAEELAFQETPTSNVVSFPERALPQLSVFELDNGTSVFTLSEGVTPPWMPPPVAWEDPAFLQRSSAGSASFSEVKGIPVKQTKGAAEELVQHFGVAEQGHRKKGRK